MKRILKTLFVLISSAVLLISCNRNSKVQELSENQLFEIPYGNFEEQLSISDLNNIGNCRFGIAMRDGFFYIVNGEAKKIMELNSYGDLLTLFYNEDSEISRLISKSNRPDESVHHEISYPFDFPGKLAIDSNKNIYVVCTIPRDRQEQTDKKTSLYCDTVLRFARDGSSVDYIGQQGPGGTPFPYIINIYTTSNDELVVVAKNTEGMIVYWFATDGYLKYMVPVREADVPELKSKDAVSENFLTIQNVVPDLNDYKLYVNVDYFSTYIDEESKVQSGINYVQTMLHTLNIENESYEAGVIIPPYEEYVVSDYSRLTYRIPYDFMGVTKSGWKFFIVKTDDGFNVEMIQPENQKNLRRHFVVNHSDILFDTMHVSENGLITAFYLQKENSRVVWYRTDTLIESILKN